MIKAIIFDFDGVIHNTLELAYKINKKLGAMATLEEYKDFFNGNIYQHKQIFPEKVKKFFKLQNPKFKKLIIKQNIKEELYKLEQDYDLFIISSNMEAALNSYLKNNKIEHIFKEVLGLESHKSKVYKFRWLMKKHGLGKNNSVFITDTLGDILEAKRVGIKTIAVDYGFHDRARLERGRPHKIVSDFRELAVEIKILMESES
ncbi:hypothetical protein A3H09_02960 [Candidatus Falkowbacteria bacterium RIFCSPLOWO2_12_FULL_45_13]|uniref:FCP1 homology domain-containing protein n=2 Tax=Candidatus Falkowiibacteriota TaxID=1752728 RepID=A0A1F5SAY3_9BACT|nr:MAG: hypothetical protein A3H66_00135 [Candidatus Falkowbacteria bacterium RIFCSPLOWO2_02_FULL_45_21]OGF30476.1 MAG: hypothetical protein A3H09_02960 [Candidatus Falkowbacteria bacterium RIFCSPLOWO2_12_FULL_45_13]